jgi:sugar (pentulose or hexulose) kinase
MLLAGAERGRLVNVIGSTDVLAMCVDRPIPHEELLTRPLGVGDQWLSVGTIAAAGNAVDWMRKLLFGEMSDETFFALVRRLSRVDVASKIRDETDVEIEPHFAGSRTQIEPMTGTIRGLTLGTNRQDMLAGLLNALALASFERWRVMMKNAGIATTTCGEGEVHVTGGGAAMASHYQRYWPGRWKRRVLPEATLRGLGRLAELAGR